MKWLLSSCFILLFIPPLPAQKTRTGKGVVEIEYTPGHPVNRFIPSQAAGAAFDGHSKGDIDLILSPENIAIMKTVGFGPISYRLRSELANEAWHWNPSGTWSEPDRQQGYWVSDTSAKSTIQLCYGYRLPRRGNTHDQANDDGYSMIDDGDSTTYWKSNPYLDEYFTKESNDHHPQWIIIDLGKVMPVNAVRINWGTPFALSFTADYAPDIGNSYFEPFEPGLWHSFPNGTVNDLHGENKVITLANQPQVARFIRITMTTSSHTAAGSAADIRDQLGFAIKEIQVGYLNEKRKFINYVRNGTSNMAQSTIYVSSTDPWHRAADLDPDTEQVGIDRFFQSGLSNNKPPLFPVALLYDTPENMQALLQYLRSKKYPVNEMEMGEEPEGQRINPEDYAALYCLFADAIKKVAPALQLGGPGFASLATTAEDGFSFTEQKWTQIFLQYLRAHSHIKDFNFFTFEWYPFDDICAPAARQLPQNPGLMNAALYSLQKDILPPGTPLYITEYGYSAYSGRSEMTIEGAILYADILGQFLAMGGNKAFLYGYDPTYPDTTFNCSWGNNMLFGMDGDGKIIYRTAAYYSMRMLLQRWAVPSDSLLEVYPARLEIRGKKEALPVTAYAILRQGNKWSLLLINKDPRKTWKISVNIADPVSQQSSFLHFPLQCTQYSEALYHWKDNGSDGYPTLALPPVEKKIRSNSAMLLPPYSITVLTETGSGL